MVPFVPLLGSDGFSPGALAILYRDRYRGGGAGRSASATTSVRGFGDDVPIDALTPAEAAIVQTLRDIRDAQVSSSRWSRASSIAFLGLAAVSLVGGAFAFAARANRRRLA